MGKDANRRSQNLGIAKISMGQTSPIFIVRIFKAHDVDTLPQYTGLSGESMKHKVEENF